MLKLWSHGDRAVMAWIFTLAVWLQVIEAEYPWTLALLPPPVIGLIILIVVVWILSLFDKDDPDDSQ